MTDDSFVERNRGVVICSFFSSFAFPDAQLRLPVYMISFVFLYCLQDTIARLQQEDVHEI